MGGKDRARAVGEEHAGQGVGIFEALLGEGHIAPLRRIEQRQGGFERALRISLNEVFETGAAFGGSREDEDGG